MFAFEKNICIQNELYQSSKSVSQELVYVRYNLTCHSNNIIYDIDKLKVVSIFCSVMQHTSMCRPIAVSFVDMSCYYYTTMFVSCSLEVTC